MLWIGVLLVLVSSAAAHIEARVHPWNHAWATIGWCPVQQDTFDSHVRALEQDLRESETRQGELKKALSNPSHPAFGIARERLKEENQHHDDVKAERDGLTIRSEAHELPSAIVFSVALLALVAGIRLLVLGAANTVSDHALRRWAASYAIWGIVLNVLVQTPFIYKGVFPTKRTWVGWDSFCISPRVWILERFAVLGLCLAVTHPLSVLWRLGDRELAPKTVLPLDPGGDCGVGRYVLFLQTWTILSVGYFVVGGIVWLRLLRTEGVTSDPVYVVPVIGGMLYGAIVAARFVRNGLLLRARYDGALAGLGSTWKEVQDSGPAPDPTRDFLGESWWKLPATLLGIALAFWTVFEWAHVSELVAGVLR